MKRLVLLLAFIPLGATARQQTLRDVHAIYVKPMVNGFDRYLVAALSEKMPKMTVVTSEGQADATLEGYSQSQVSGSPSTVVHRILGLDLTAGTVQLVAKDGKTILWADQSGDKSMIPVVGIRKTGQRKIATRLIKNLRKAMKKRNKSE